MLLVTSCQAWSDYRLFLNRGRLTRYHSAESLIALGMRLEFLVLCIVDWLEVEDGLRAGPSGLESAGLVSLQLRWTLVG